LQDATIDYYCCSELDTTDGCFHWTGQDKTKWGKVKGSARIQRRWQNILTQLSVVTGQARKDKTKWGKVKGSACIQCRWQNILTQLSVVAGQARKAITPFQAWNCFIRDEILDNIVQHRN